MRSKRSACGPSLPLEVALGVQLVEGELALGVQIVLGVLVLVLLLLVKA